MTTPPLSLYIHIPWCVQKCPYCDFNSHGLKSELPDSQYISHLLDDLSNDAKKVPNRKIETIFFGGGTPSLFSADAIQKILQGVADRIELDSNAEITLEANPGTVESDKFKAYRQAGINRISIGVQSFQSNHLKGLGRIHDQNQAVDAIREAQDANLDSFNVDLMHGLSEQSLLQAMGDLDQAIALNVPHLSWYQLTIEPNTLFHSKPPPLSEDEVLWEIQEQGQKKLAQAGYTQYEVSGYSKPGQQCQHNLNYWRYGDYLGIGCGAHGKITFPEKNVIERTAKVKHPKGYMDLSKSYIDKAWEIEEAERPFEFFMNQFRLNETCPASRYEATTGLDLTKFGAEQKLKMAEAKGLLEIKKNGWTTTLLGKRYLNDLLTLFL